MNSIADKPTRQLKTEIIPGLKVGLLNRVSIKFMANPQPLHGVWQIDGVADSVNVGTRSANGLLRADNFKYQVRLRLPSSREVPVFIVMHYF